MKINEPRPICPECGEVVDPTEASVLHKLKGDEAWINAPSLLLGVYCCSDHLLNAYLRGWPSASISGPDIDPNPRRGKKR